MSLESWKEEFYPLGACHEFQEHAVSHSLRKWRGLTPENLRKHDVHKKYHSQKIKSYNEQSGLFNFLEIDTTTCALCFYYLGKADKTTSKESSAPPAKCTNCPLYLVRGERCDCKRLDECWSPYTEFTSFNNPWPMIRWLERATQWEKEHGTPAPTSKTTPAQKSTTPANQTTDPENQSP